jgi:aspartyl-tRNA synthetase
LNKKFKLEDNTLRQLNFVALDLELSFMKIENMSEPDAHLLQDIQQEQKEIFATPSKT